jgi:predicted nucleic acid-binding protein
VIGPDVAMRLADEHAVIGEEHQILAPTLLRSQQELGWSSTYDAEYVALTQLQADAFVTLHGELALAVRDLVRIAPVEALSRPA